MRTAESFEPVEIGRAPARLTQVDVLRHDGTFQAQSLSEEALSKHRKTASDATSDEGL